MLSVRTGATAVFMALLATSGAAGAAAEASFQSCVSRLQQEARAAGVSGEVAQRTLASAELREGVIELDRSQPEFTKPFGTYLNERVTEQRVARGRRLLEEHGALLDRIYRDYGVAPRYLVAFWGMETHFGSHFGNIDVFDSLTTLACDERRSEFFTEQLIAALSIVEGAALDPTKMRGSWAGAMGHVQFMPTVFQRYAVDYDGDGSRDLWNSVPDAMASAARFLSEMGWEQGWRWGREVTLPPDFDYAKAGAGKARPLSEWKAMGVRTAYDRPLAGSGVEARLLLPSGHAGPTFLVYPNFDVIMGWNPSQYYALSVGYFADRLAGVAGLVNQPPADAPRLAREDVEALQRRLNEKGFDAGPVDGIPGPSTRAAIQRFQQSRGMVADGFPSRAVLEALSIQVAEH